MAQQNEQCKQSKKTIRTFSQQENVEDKWDDYLHFFISAHNKSTSIYGFSPEQLHFGFSNPAVAHAMFFSLLKLPNYGLLFIVP
jgi:hypothetical protein